MRRGIAQQVAFGGVFAALALTIMYVIGLIPVATFICPMLCIVLCATVYVYCGRRIGWAWYGAVTFLSLFLAPDKEAALVFLFLGYYPMLKVRFDRIRKISFFWKALYFNIIIILIYFVMLRILGLSELLDEYSGIGITMGIILIAMGNLSFFLLDYILKRVLYKNRS